MGRLKFLWDTTKYIFTGSLIGITVSDRYASLISIKGISMYPTFNPRGDGPLTRNIHSFCILIIQCTSPHWAVLSPFSPHHLGDRVLLEKLCLEKYKFSKGDVVVFRSPSDHRKRNIKRITGLPGDWISAQDDPHDAVIVPEGHCWVEGDNAPHSFDSRSHGPVPLGLICGRVTHIVWPPQRFGSVERRLPRSSIPTL